MGKIEDFRFRRNCWQWIQTEFPEVIESIVNGEDSNDPIHVEIHPHHSSTEMCNNRCVACTGGIYRGLDGKLDFGIEPARLFETIKIFKGRVNDIIFSGNSIEPLIYPEIVEAIKNVHNIGAMFSLYSNFYYANRPGVMEEITSPSTLLDYIRISLNAGTKESYNQSHFPKDPNAFDIVLENIKELLRLKKEKDVELYVHLTYLLDKQNSRKQELEGIVKWAAENKGISGIRFGVYQKPLGKKVPGLIDFSENEFNENAKYTGELAKTYFREDFVIEGPWIRTDKFEKQKTFDNCRVGLVFPVIAMDGGVYPCTSMASSSNKTGFCYGNINTDVFWDIWDVIKTKEGFPILGCYDCTRAEFDINQRFKELMEK
jgi:MoaA/NifB/PqqE/SkfB family radical SAM enzyme